jgi:hypothetical protein
VIWELSEGLTSRKPCFQHGYKYESNYTEQNILLISISFGVLTPCEIYAIMFINFQEGNEVICLVAECY